MKRININNSCLVFGAGVAVLVSSLLLSVPLFASDYSYSGESNTIFRMRKTIDDKNVYPAYEYLRLNMTNERSDGSAVSFNFGAWGRADLGDKPDNSGTKGDIQYAAVAYHAPKNNTVFTVGRQFISEGVATERLDGIYLRNDFQYGIGVSAFIGKSVTTEEVPALKNNDSEILFGTRVSQSNKKNYSIGISALKSKDGKYREEEGLDLWLRPLQQVDINGRSTYNSITDGWMEHSYAVSYSPLTALNLGASFSHINLKDYLFNLTTPAFSNPLWSDNNKQTTYGVSATYSGIKNLTVAGDYKNYNYDKSGDAAYFGGKLSYSLPQAVVIGGSIHRMDGKVDKLCYLEYRAFLSKKIGHADLTLDAINVNYDKSINGISNSYAVVGAAGYEINRKLKVGADVEYSRNPDFNREVRALVKATYMFDSKSAAEGGSKSEK